MASITLVKPEKPFEYVNLFRKPSSTDTYCSMDNDQFQQHNANNTNKDSVPSEVSLNNDDVLTIVYQDDYLVAINKPSGLLVHRSPIDRHEHRFALQLLRNQLGQWVYPIHRLDKPTSGLLVFALSSEIAEAMGHLIMQHQFHKQYLAIVRGHTPLGGIIRHPIRETAAFKHQKKTIEQQVPKPALTVYHRLATWQLPIPDGRHPTSRYALLRLAPKTGRKHQIRKHLKHISHPIIGDVKYGKGEHNRLFQQQFDNQRLLLAATSVSFVHPVTHQKLTIQCAPENSFQKIIDGLGKPLTRSNTF